MDDSWHYLDKPCSICGGKIRSYFGFDKCEECGHGYLTNYTDSEVEISSTRDDGSMLVNIPEEDSKTTPLPLYLRYNKTRAASAIVKPDELTPNNLTIDTLTITNCELIRLHHKELDIEFEFDTKKLENIDTIKINGYRFVKER